MSEFVRTSIAMQLYSFMLLDCGRQHIAEYVMRLHPVFRIAQNAPSFRFRNSQSQSAILYFDPLERTHGSDEDKQLLMPNLLRCRQYLTHHNPNKEVYGRRNRSNVQVINVVNNSGKIPDQPEQPACMQQ